MTITGAMPEQCTRSRSPSCVLRRLIELCDPREVNRTDVVDVVGDPLHNPIHDRILSGRLRMQDGLLVLRALVAQGPHADCRGLRPKDLVVIARKHVPQLRRCWHVKPSLGTGLLDRCYQVERVVAHLVDACILQARGMQTSFT